MPILGGDVEGGGANVSGDVVNASASSHQRLDNLENRAQRVQNEKETETVKQGRLKIIGGKEEHTSNAPTSAAI